MANVNLSDIWAETQKGANSAVNLADSAIKQAEAEMEKAGKSIKPVEALDIMSSAAKIAGGA